VVVAVVAVRVVEVALDQVVDVVAVRDRLVPAARTVDVPGLVRAAVVVGRAACRKLAGDLEDVLVDVRLVRAVQVPAVQVVDVVAVLHGRVAAAGAVDVAVLAMLLAGHGWRVDRRGTRGQPAVVRLVL
jgi:hypothetical protein